MNADASEQCHSPGESERREHRLGEIEKCCVIREKRWCVRKSLREIDFGHVYGNYVCGQEKRGFYHPLTRNEIPDHSDKDGEI